MTADYPGVPDDFPALPDGSRIEIVEATDDRLVIHIPAGGQHAARQGWAALVLSGVMIYASQPGVIADFQRQRALPQFSVNLCLAIGWTVCIGMALYWLRMRFERSTLLVEIGRVVMRQIIFGWTRTTAITLGADSRAGVVEAYQGQNHPVHRIEISGADGRVKFGTPLSEREKGWLVDCINAFLDTAQAAPTIGVVPVPALADTAQSSSTSQRELPAPMYQSGIKVFDSTDDRLVLFIPGGGPQGLPRSRTVKCVVLSVVVTVIGAATFDMGFPIGFIVTVTAFIALLWIISLLLIFEWVKSQFPHTLLQLGRDRIIVERALLNLKWTDEARLGPESSASIVEAFREQVGITVKPVFQIEVRGIGDSICFGIPLAELEKLWLVDRINEFIQQDADR